MFSMVLNTLLEGYQESRSSHRRYSIEKLFLNFTGKHLCWSLFLIKLYDRRPATLLKRDSNTVVVLWDLGNFWERLIWGTSINDCSRNKNKNDWRKTLINSYWILHLINMYENNAWLNWFLSMWCFGKTLVTSSKSIINVSFRENFNFFHKIWKKLKYYLTANLYQIFKFSYRINSMRVRYAICLEPEIIHFRILAGI